MSSRSILLLQGDLGRGPVGKILTREGGETFRRTEKTTREAGKEILKVRALGVDRTKRRMDAE